MKKTKVEEINNPDILFQTLKGLLESFVKFLLELEFGKDLLFTLTGKDNADEICKVLLSSWEQTFYSVLDKQGIHEIKEMFLRTLVFMTALTTAINTAEILLSSDKNLNQTLLN